MNINNPIVSDKELLSFYKQIGKNVKKCREEKGMTQLDLSQAMGYQSVSLVSKAEIVLENVHFGIKHLYFISKILDVELSSLIEFKKYTY
jgi:putative transcriptional regulator